MKKIAALIVLAAFAATPAVAASKKKAQHKDPKHMTFDEAMSYNKKNLGLLVDGLPLVLPSWSLPVYFHMKDGDDKAKHGKKKR